MREGLQQLLMVTPVFLARLGGLFDYPVKSSIKMVDPATQLSESVKHPSGQGNQGQYQAADGYQR
jgi:hypothetical protein